MIRAPEKRLRMHPFMTPTNGPWCPKSVVMVMTPEGLPKLLIGRPCPHPRSLSTCRTRPHEWRGPRGAAGPRRGLIGAKYHGSRAPVSSAYDRLPLNALRVFEAVAARLNFGEAAEALHVTPAAVSQQIKTLEDYLQTPLLRRNGRNVQLTPEGARLLPAIRRGLDELEAALQSLRQERHTGTVSVSTLASFLQKWLMPRLADLRARHPEIELRIHSSPELVDFARTDFHAAIRFGAGGYEGLHSQKLLDEWLVAVAAPALLAKHGPLPDAGALAKLPLLHGTEIDWANWCAGDTSCLKQLPGAYIDDSASLLP